MIFKFKIQNVLIEKVTYPSSILTQQLCKPLSPPTPLFWPCSLSPCLLRTTCLNFSNEGLDLESLMDFLCPLSHLFLYIPQPTKPANFESQQLKLNPVVVRKFPARCHPSIPLTTHDMCATCPINRPFPLWFVHMDLQFKTGTLRFIFTQANNQHITTCHRITAMC